jgi:futalosine hydrolase
MKLIALLSAVPFESEAVLFHMERIRKIGTAGKTAYKGRLSDNGVLLMHTGIGKVNAAHAATAVMENFPVDYMIVFGTGGAYPRSGLSTGDIAVASKEIFGDEGVIGREGWKDIRAIGIPVVSRGGRRYFNEFPLDKRLIPPRLKRNKEAFNVKTGPFITVSSVTGTRKRAEELEQRFHAICENMEGAAVAQVCTQYGIPMLEVRGISNITGVRDKRKWNLKLSAENCQRAVLDIISFL